MWQTLVICVFSSVVNFSILGLELIPLMMGTLKFIRRFAVLLLLFNTALAFGVKKPALPEWRKFLNRTFRLVFVDSERSRRQLDSLLDVARRSNDAERMAHTTEIYGLVNLFQNDSLQAEQLFTKAERYLEKNGDFLSLGEYSSAKAQIIFNKLKYTQAEPLLLKSLAWFRNLREEAYQIPVFYRLGTLYRFSNQPGESIKMYTAGLKIAERAKDSLLLFEGNVYLGTLMQNLQADKQTEQYFLNAKEFAEAAKDTLMMANSYYYLSGFYNENRAFARAKLYAEKALRLLNHSQNGQLYGSLSGMLASMYLAASKPDSAMLFAQKALNLSVEMQNKTGILEAKHTMARAAMMKGDAAQARELMLSCSDYARDLGYTEAVASIYRCLSEAEFRLGFGDKAYEHLNEFITINDSISRQEAHRLTMQTEAMFQNEKKQLLIESLNKDKAMQQSILQARNKVVFASLAGLLISVVFLFFIWKGYQRKRRDNLLIRQQRDMMEVAKQQVEDKNAEIIQSINYAKRLQDAILPDPRELAACFSENFIFYEPKDLVAGDFYWLEKYRGKIYLAVCDCTGHGVPGAMLSVVGHNGLQRCVRENDLSDPGKILDQLSLIVEETFSHANRNVRDGMDVSLCVYDPATRQLQWAGANNPLWIVSASGEFRELKGDKQPIGKYDLRKPFSTHNTTLNENDSLYLFSDGLADQFGGPKGKKFKYAPIKKLLTERFSEPMQQQLSLLSESFTTWKGNLEQVDDICVIGIRV